MVTVFGPVVVFRCLRFEELERNRRDRVGRVAEAGFELEGDGFVGDCGGAWRRGVRGGEPQRQIRLRLRQVHG